MKMSELIEMLQERIEETGDIEVAVQSTIDGDICDIIWDEQIAVQKTPTGKIVLAFSPTGDWTDFQRYQSN